MTDQELFDKVAAHLLRQGKTAITGKGCAYRTSAGLMCAAGCLIKDEFYSEDLETYTVNRPEVKEAIIASLGGGEINWKLLSKLQQVHDYYSVRAWGSRLAKIAEEFELNFKSVGG